MNRPARELIEAALAEAALFSSSFPVSRVPLLRRLEARTGALLVIAAEEDPEFAGRCATGQLDGQGAISLSILEPAPLRIDAVRVADPGTSAWEAGAPVSIITPSNPGAAYPPRAYLRDLAIEQHGTELDGVLTVHVFYTRCARALASVEDRVEIPSPHDELLVRDLTAWLITRAPGMLQAERSAALEVVTADTEDLLAAWRAYVRNFAAARVSDFGAGGSAR